MPEFTDGIVHKDFVKLYRVTAQGKKEHRATLAFGDRIRVGAKVDGWTTVIAPELFDGDSGEWLVKGGVSTRPAGAPGVLRLTMVDVQQGDGLVLDTPGGKVMLVDGGDNKLFARHVAARYAHRKSSAAAPLDVAAIVVTHGDADHFAGLSELQRSEALPASKANKRVFLRPRRVLHNGLVKRPTSVKDVEQFGATLVDAQGRTWVTELVADPRSVPPTQRNQAFDRWAETLDDWAQRGPIDVRRIHADTDPSEVFDFLEQEGIHVELLGPIQEEIASPAGPIAALPFLAAPKQAAELHLEHGGPEPGRPSASHTINGHSIVMRLRYGNVRLLLTGDLNRPALERLENYIQSHPDRGTLQQALGAEIIKAPHHGSDDFAFSALAAMKPVVALVSSGDESEFKEYIHPRATLMAALGRVTRGNTGVVLCTELAAFFNYRKQAHTRSSLQSFFNEHAKSSFTRAELVELFRGEGLFGADNDPDRSAIAGSKGPDAFESFERTNFGIVHIRTDGKRVLVFTHSGQRGLNEAYRFEVGADQSVAFREIETD